MSGGKSSQRKGRVEELAAAKEAAEFGLISRPHGQYETLDITIEGDMYEVKHCEKLSLKRAYDALNAGARGLIARVNRQPRIIAIEYRDWLEDQRELKEYRRNTKTQIVLTDKGREALEELYDPYIPTGSEGC